MADAFTTVLRAYDLVIKYGGDEFPGSIPGIDAAAARTRLNRINTNLAAAGEPGSVVVGIAHLQGIDTGRRGEPLAADITASSTCSPHAAEPERIHTRICN